MWLFVIGGLVLMGLVCEGLSYYHKNIKPTNAESTRKTIVILVDLQFEWCR